MGQYRYGFKAEAERLALELRAELGIGVYERLDPHALAGHLAVPVWTLDDLPHVLPDVPALQAAVAVLQGPERAAFSAMTVFRGTERVIVHNAAHAVPRQASNLCHELAHGVLLHPPGAALGALGCRDWDGEIEREATFLAGALLVPIKAIWWAAKQRQPRHDIAEQYGCSPEMVQMRLNLTGAGKRFS